MAAEDTTVSGLLFLLVFEETTLSRLESYQL